MHDNIDGGWATRELELLYDNVLSEMDNQNWSRNLGLTSAALEQLASAVTASIDYAFDVRWSPDWVKPGTPHVWRDGDGWHARCNACLAESPASTSEDAVQGWFTQHDRERHPERA